MSIKVKDIKISYDQNTIIDQVSFQVEQGEISELATRMPVEISGGQQQRVAIARALTLKQKILFMDEPFSSLDPYLKEHGFQGKTKTGSSIDRFIFSESFEVLFSERKGKETITVISSHGEELTVIQQDNMNFIKGETVYLQVLNPYMNIISMDDFNISSISTHTYHPIPQG